MVRTIGLVGLLLALAIGGFLVTKSAKQQGPTSKQASSIEAQASAVLGAANFQQAAAELEAYRAQSGSYQGATLPPAFGVALVAAGPASYCLQTGTGSTLQHETGPGGSPVAGPC